MAEILDPVEVDESETSPLVETPQEPEQEVQAQEDGQADIPEEYRDKSMAEIAKMHQEAMKKIGEQGTELGQTRKIIDDFILKQSEEKAPEPAEEVDWYSDPDKALEAKLSNHPVVKEMEKNVRESNLERSKQAVLTKHPDAQEIIQDQNFTKWVEGSEIRKELLARADRNYDHLAADELFSTWKQMRQASKSAVESEKDSRKQAVKKASTGDARGSSEASPKKIYRRADIIELMKTDPARYLAMEPDIRQAYAEKRVR